jgi:hypothetical protein
MHLKPLVTLAAATLASAQAQCSSSITPRFSGSFIQPWLLASWDSITLSSSLGHLRDACITTEILQWTLDTAAKTVAYPTSLPGYTRMSSVDLVGTLLSAADATGVQVYLGLQLGSDWFDNSANNPAWLAAQASLSKQIATELQAKYATHPSFAGWYLPFEMDNLNFPTPTQWDRMAAFYADVIAHLKSFSPRPVAIAPFFNPAVGFGPPAWQQMWAHILARAPIDIIALQDGCGAGAVPTSALPAWFSATRNAIEAARPGSRLFSDTETFTKDPTNGGFRTEGWNKVLSQMRTVKPYVDGLWAFSYEHYQSPAVGRAPYHDAYRRYLAGGGDTTKPSTPAPPQKAGANGLTWAAVSDNVAVAGYEVYRNNLLVGFAATNEWTDAKAVAGTTYAYALVAYDAFGNRSAMGQAASIVM